MKKLLLKTSLIFLTLSAVVSCDFKITEVNPHQLDTHRGWARKYEFFEVKREQCGDPGFDVRFTNERVPIEDMSGWTCFPPSQTQYAYRKYLKFIEDEQKCKPTNNIKE